MSGNESQGIPGAVPPRRPAEAIPVGPPQPAYVEPPARPSGGFPVWAIVLIVIGCMIPILGIFAGFLFPALFKAQEAARRAACMNNVRQIGLAMIQYATDHDDAFPDLVTMDGAEVPGYDGTTISTEPARSAFALLLNKGYLNTTKVFICPASRDRMTGEDFPWDYKDADLQELILKENNCSYGWDPTKRHSAHACCAIIADKPSGDVSKRGEGTARNNSDNHKKEGQNVFYNDGHVKWGTTSMPDSGDDPDIYLGDPGYETSTTDAKIIR